MQAIIFIMLLSLCFNCFANDEYDALLVDGPGIFSGDKGEIPFDSLFGKKEKAKADETTSAKSNNLLNEQEFELFRIWHQAKQEQNADYQEFLDWLAYRKYKQANQ